MAPTAPAHTGTGTRQQAEANGNRPVCVSEKQEARVDELLQRISPNVLSETRRHFVAQYVTDIITRCFAPACEVLAFMFGSVPLKTYLPDGDIDLALFQKTGPSIRNNWYKRLADILEAEQRRPGPFAVRDVQVINAEVRLLKCLVDNIVVDISFETLGGLCTLAFLESIDRKLQEDNLFKRSIILVKAWCYYESRLLGAHHGLLSTYALETMVLYLLNSHHHELNTPLKVLHKFLQVFGEFDWDQFCLSLHGPVSLASVQNPSEALTNGHSSPRLPEAFHTQMVAMYSSAPKGASARPFACKHINIMDPLAASNNLGRSVSKASFLRLRKALKRGALTLGQAIAQDGEHSTSGIDHFLKTAWGAVRQRTWEAAAAVPHQNGFSPEQPQLAPLHPPAQPGRPPQGSASAPASPAPLASRGMSAAAAALPAALEAHSRQASKSMPQSQPQAAPHPDYQQLDWREQLQNGLLPGHVPMSVMHMPYGGGVSMAYPVHVPMHLPMARMQFPPDPRLYAYLQHLQPAQALPPQDTHSHARTPSSQFSSRPASPAPQHAPAAPAAAVPAQPQAPGLSGDLESLSQNLRTARICLQAGDSRAASPAPPPPGQAAAGPGPGSLEATQQLLQQAQQDRYRQDRPLRANGHRPAGPMQPGRPQSAQAAQARLGGRSLSHGDLAAGMPWLHSNGPAAAGLARSNPPQRPGELRGESPVGLLPPGPVQGLPAPAPGRPGSEGGQISLVSTGPGRGQSRGPFRQTPAAFMEAGSRSLGGSPLASQAPEGLWSGHVSEADLWHLTHGHGLPAVPPPPPAAPSDRQQQQQQQAPATAPMGGFVMRDDDFPSLGPSRPQRQARQAAEAGMPWAPRQDQTDSSARHQPQ